MLPGFAQFFERRGAPAGPTARDYVQTGLVAMWDGIENAGWGVHDASATVWKDLITGYDLDVTSGTWGQKGLVGTSTTECNATLNNVPSGFIDILTNDGCSVEAVATPHGYGTHIYALSSSVWRIYGWGNTAIWNYFRIQSGPLSIMDRGVIGEPISFSGTTDAEKKGRWYCNGGLIFGPSSYSKPTPDSTVYLGIKGTIHVCRIYNRTLSATEIAANYAIDKARFNLQ